MKNRPHILSMALVAFVLVGFTVFGSGCTGAGGKACQVVDLAKTACDTLPIRYLGPNGEVVEEQVPADELKVAVQRARARRLGMPVPSSSGAP